MKKTAVLDKLDADPAEPPDAASARERRRPGLWIAWAVFALVAVQLVGFVLGNPRLEWPVVATYLFSPQILAGLWTTALITAISMVIGVSVGAVVCLCRTSSYLPLRLLGGAWVTVFRSIPPIVQLLFWFNLAYLFPVLSIGLPFGPSFGDWDANAVISPAVAAVVGLSLYTSPYSAEIVRSGLISVPRGQIEASTSLGLPWRTAFFSIQLPQATRVILPPIGNLTISTLKGSALVSVIGMTDLLGAATRIYSRNFEVVPLLMVAIIWYGVLVGGLTLGQAWLERRFSRGY